ncbi:MAG: malonyl-ACP O-methyltransferase BioC [Gammaproteobacteria bacterium]
MPLEYQAIKNSFNRVAKNYSENAVLQQEILSRLLERLSDEKKISAEFQSKALLELGCGPGWSFEELLNGFAIEQLTAIEFSKNMLAQTPDYKQVKTILSDVHELPLEDESQDVVFSNMMLHWCNESDVFKESFRVLKPNGLLLMSCLGETSLFELKQAWSEIDSKVHVHDFPALHSLGDLLLKTGFTQVVVNAEVITLTYENIRSLMKDIKASGGQNAMENRSKGLMSKEKLYQLNRVYEQFREDGRLPASYEIIYLRAKKPEQVIKKV